MRIVGTRRFYSEKEEPIAKVGRQVPRFVFSIGLDFISIVKILPSVFSVGVDSI